MSFSLPHSAGGVLLLQIKIISVISLVCLLLSLSNAAVPVLHIFRLSASCSNTATAKCLCLFPSPPNKNVFYNLIFCFSCTFADIAVYPLEIMNCI